MFRTLRNYRFTAFFGVAVTRQEEAKIPSLPPAPRVIPSEPPPSRPLASPGLAKCGSNVMALASRRKAG